MSIDLNTNEGIAWINRSALFPVDVIRDFGFWIKQYSDPDAPDAYHVMADVNGGNTTNELARFYQNLAQVDPVLGSVGSSNTEFYQPVNAPAQFPRGNEWALVKIRLQWTEPSSKQVTLRQFRVWRAGGDSGELIDGDVGATILSAAPDRFSLGGHYTNAWQSGFVPTTRYAHVFVADEIDSTAFPFFTTHTPDIAAQLAGVTLRFQDALDDLGTISGFDPDIVNNNVAAGDIHADMPDLISSLGGRRRRRHRFFGLGG